MLRKNEYLTNHQKSTLISCISNNSNGILSPLPKIFREMKYEVVNRRFLTARFLSAKTDLYDATNFLFTISISFFTLILVLSAKRGSYDTIF